MIVFSSSLRVIISARFGLNSYSSYSNVFKGLKRAITFMDCLSTPVVELDSSDYFSAKALSYL